MVKKLKTIADTLSTLSDKELGFRPTFSVGLSEFTQAELADMDVTKLVADVDANLYEAKKRGKNMIIVGGVSIPFK